MTGRVQNLNLCAGQACSLIAVERPVDSPGIEVHPVARMLGETGLNRRWLSADVVIVTTRLVQGEVRFSRQPRQH